MRKQLIKSVEKILNDNDKSVLLLGDIGVFGFRNAFKNYPNRVYNIGILEQSTISLAAGLSKVELIPFVHTIAPFIVERALEQLKIDFGYQNINGNFISVGASYDYVALGSTHHCPADIIVLSSIPNMQIVSPGSSSELDILLNESYNNGSPTYYRLSEYEHSQKIDVDFGKANVIKKGKKATIICFGNLLDNVMEASKDLDVTILYYSTLIPFDYKTLSDNYNKIIITCEPFYQGSLNYQINEALQDKYYKLKNIGIKREFLTNYGIKEQHDKHQGLDVKSLTNKLKDICLT